MTPEEARAAAFLNEKSNLTKKENIRLLESKKMKSFLEKQIKKGGFSRMAKKRTSKLMRIPQGLVNTALKVAKKTRKGAVKVTRRAGKGVFNIAGTTVNTTAGLAKNVLGTLTGIGVNATKGVGKAVKNSVGAVASITKGTLKGVRRIARGRKSRRNNATRRNSRR